VVVLVVLVLLSVVLVVVLVVLLVVVLVVLVAQVPCWPRKYHRGPGARTCGAPGGCLGPHGRSIDRSMWPPDRQCI
jgi:hypothetical protein